ncbi:hypothetical protein [Flavobacterium psychrotrophum]|uniref:hypothetical protein n=1 Tax=Flavobacterium psychrotrophum TaxID=2294119 RepID=UPI000E31ED5E|nr:hypothetical protein [Flavobacterium psychrotrophum]
MKCNFWLLLLIIASVAEAQEKKTLDGKVIAGEAIVTGIFVINKRTGAEIKTDGSGRFQLESKAGDRIVIYGSNVETREFVLGEASFTQHPYVLEAEPKTTNLHEVVINHINPESLGLVPKGQKIVTERERAYMRNSGGEGLEYLMNALMGRLWVFRMATDAMHKEDLVNEIEAIVNDSELKAFGIPEEMARGFLFYVVEDKRVANVVHTNKYEIKLLLIELADEYMKLQQER